MKRKKSGIEMTRTIYQLINNPFLTPIIIKYKYLDFICVGGLNNRPLSVPEFSGKKRKGVL